MALALWGCPTVSGLASLVDAAYAGTRLELNSDFRTKKDRLIPVDLLPFSLSPTHSPPSYTLRPTLICELTIGLRMQHDILHIEFSPHGTRFPSCPVKQDSFRSRPAFRPHQVQMLASSLETMSRIMSEVAPRRASHPTVRLRRHFHYRQVENLQIGNKAVHVIQSWGYVPFQNHRF